MNDKKINYIITIIVNNDVRNIYLNDFGKTIIKFGRHRKNDIVIDSPYVSKYHGYFSISNGKVIVVDSNSKNGIIYNEEKNKTFEINDKDFFRIDNTNERLKSGVLILFSITNNLNRWHRYKITNKETTIIGTTKECNILLNNLKRNGQYARTIYKDNNNYIESNTTIKINNKETNDINLLKDRDIINIEDSTLIYNKNHLLYQFSTKGIKLEADDIVKTVWVKGKKKDIVQHISMRVMPGEFVSIIGESGSGKSSFMKCICGLSIPTSGSVYLNGVDLYKNYEDLKKLIGYVPQDDIVFNDLTLMDMLSYSAILRMPEDATESERKRRIKEVISTVELEGKEAVMIKNLSGGQRKRAGIAVELLADPKLFFLDEPTSGLDPGTERKMMHTLRKIANQGRTVILVTHNTLNLHLCDKVVFFNQDGNICFSGSPEQCFKFFNVKDFVDIYNYINDEPNRWHNKYVESSLYEKVNVEEQDKEKLSIENDRKSFSKQFTTLTRRYMKTIINNKRSLLITLLLGPAISFLFSLIASKKLFAYYSITEMNMFCYCIASIFIGLSNSVQEICKERVILQKEYMADLKLSSYLSSKVIVMFIFSIIQSILLINTFCLLINTPLNGLIFSWKFEMIIECCLTIFASSMLGLLVSSLASDSTVAMMFTPLLLVPQLVLTGIFFELSSKIKFISLFIISRWSLELMGTTSDLNSTVTTIEELIPTYHRQASSHYEFTKAHFYTGSIALIILTILFLLLCFLSLKKQLAVNKKYEKTIME